jgi:hypothetical protein
MTTQHEMEMAYTVQLGVTSVVSDIALIDRIELRPQDDRIAPLSDDHIDGDNARDHPSPGQLGLTSPLTAM